MSDWIIYHNPRCGKSRTTLELLEEHGIEPKIVLYLRDPPPVDVLRELARMLGRRPGGLVRQQEPLLKDLNLDFADDDAVLAALAQHPILLERPIVVHDNRAVLGRPPNNILELLPPK